MRKGISVLSFVLIASLIAPSIAPAQRMNPPATGTWAAVEMVPPGDEVVVKLKDGETVKGRIDTISGSGLTLTRKNKTTAVDRDKVLTIHRVVSTSGARSTLIGLGIGGAAGGVMGAVASDRTDITMAFTVPILAGIGVGIGALVGLGVGSRQKRVLIYEAYGMN